MDNASKIAIFEEKIEEYYLSCLPYMYQQYLQKDTKVLEQWPIFKFNIQSIYKAIIASDYIPKELYDKCADKLIDIKLILSYLLTTTECFYRGPTLIVGNNEIEKLNPNTMSLLRENHYKVYLISVIIENILDLLQLVFDKQIKDYKKSKWEKVLMSVLEKGYLSSINEENVKALLEFKERYRTAELHKYSSVRAYTAKKKWNHFELESKIVREIIENLTTFFLKHKS